jgi:hypothetical protein
MVSVQDGSGNYCGSGYTTFSDDSASNTYCLAQRYSFNAPGG